MQSIREKKENRKSNELQLQESAGRGWWRCGNSCLCHHYHLVSPPCIWIIWTLRFCFSSHCSRAPVLSRLIHGFGHKDNIKNNRNNRCVSICTLSQTFFPPFIKQPAFWLNLSKQWAQRKGFPWILICPSVSFPLEILLHLSSSTLIFYWFLST